jgi:hypothetical protein
LFAHDIDASVVGGIELQDHLAHVVVAVDVAGEGEDGGGFTRAGGSVEEEVGEAVGFDEFV